MVYSLLAPDINYQKRRKDEQTVNFCKILELSSAMSMTNVTLDKYVLKFVPVGCDGFCPGHAELSDSFAKF